MPAQIQPSDKLLHKYQLTLREFRHASIEHKSATRSALEWLIDQYQLKPNSNPNRPDDPNYIFNLFHRIIRVSMETQHLIQSLPPMFHGEAA